MDFEETFGHLQFDRPQRAGSRGNILVGIGLVVFAILYMVIPASTLYWLLVPLMARVIWISSFGWRPASAAAHEFIHRLEQNVIEQGDSQ